MKFAHELEKVLQSGDFPPTWVQSAISYVLLKKCIKKVQQELEDLGLDVQTLDELLKSIEMRDDRTPLSSGAQYEFADAHESPRLNIYIVVNAEDGSLVDAGLSDETKEQLRRVVMDRGISVPRIEEVLDDDDQLVQPVANTSGVVDTAGVADPPPSTDTLAAIDTPTTTDTSVMIRQNTPKAIREASKMVNWGRSTDPTDVIEAEIATRRIEIPLTFGSEFFQMLRNELLGLDYFIERERGELTDDVLKIGRLVSRATVPSDKTDLFIWREIFELYIQANIFFSSRDQDYGPRRATTAAERLQQFSSQTRDRQVAKRFKRKESADALDQFLRLNAQLLQHLRFQEVNSTALFKILKKFDKRTALGAKDKFPDVTIGEAFLTGTMAKAVCVKLAEDVLGSVPRLEDYLCLICATILYKPVRLNCHHTFCIRCLVTLWFNRKDECPMCRQKGVLMADDGNLDRAMMNFLERYFPDEVKAKQRQNEQAAAIDRFGPSARHRCIVM